MDSESIEETAAQWVIHRHSEAWTAADQESLDAWLERSTSHRVAYLRLDSVWQQTDRLKALGAGFPPGVVPPAGSWRSRQPSDESDPDQHLARRARLRTRWVALAASVVVALFAGTYWFFTASEDKPDTYETPVGGLQTFRLEDGSEMTLNTDTHLRAYLKGGTRRIELDSGEAFFVVAKDPARPFVVSAGDTTVTAVGTQFSVKRAAAVYRVLVTEGRVQLRVSSGQGTATSMALDAGSLATAANGEVRVQHVSDEEAERLLNWRNGLIAFQNTSLVDAVAELNRYHTREFVIENPDDPALAAIRITGKFRIDNLDAFLALLQEGFPVTVEDTGDRIVLKRRK